jgi:hypothetical protein
MSAIARCAADARGLLGLDGVSAELTAIELDIRVASPSPDDRVEAMLEAWRERCPIYLALLRPRSIALSTARIAEAS